MNNDNLDPLEAAPDRPPQHVPNPELKNACFEDGMLYVHTDQDVFRLQPWPDLQAWRRTPPRHRWRRIRPRVDFECLPGWGLSVSITPYHSRFRYEQCWGDYWGNDHLQPAKELFDGFPGMDTDADTDADASDALAPASAESSSPPTRPDPMGRAGLAFLESFPKEVLSLVMPFTDRRWHMAELLCRCPQSADLIRSNPALAFGLASHWAFQPARHHPWGDLQTWMQRRQREIAGWLGFPATEQTARILRRIPPETCGIAVLRHLQRALRLTSVGDTLRHLPRLNATVIRLACDLRLSLFASPRLLRELADHTERCDLVSRHCAMLDDILRLSKLLAPFRPPPVFTSTRQLEEVHETMSAEVNKADLVEKLRLTFPPPAVPGTEDIVPLCTPKLLFEEGRELRHCVASYIDLAAQGQGFFYRVLRPERATLHVGYENEGWTIRELSGPCNREVSTATFQAVQSWLERNARQTSCQEAAPAV